MGPIFAFDVGVIVFVISSRAGELDRLFTFSEIVVEEMVNEFTSIVKVDTEDSERQRIFHILNLSSNFCETLAVGGALLRPVGGDIDRVGGKGINTVYRVTAMSHSICFKESGFEFIPLVSFNRDVMFEEKPWFGRTAAFAAVKFSNGPKRVIDGGGRDIKELLKNFW